MLTQLTTVKERLAILPTDTTYDSLLTSAIQSLSARFDLETSRTLARTENATDEFDPADTELSVSCYPIETVTKFETKSTEAEGWQEITPTPPYLIRKSCIVSLRSPLYALRSSFDPVLRVTYTGGFVLPGTEPGPGQTPLPPDLEQAAVEQTAFWFISRDHLGLKTYWPKDVAYQQFATQDLLASVTAVLENHRRWSL
jgi:hypothetical protein